MKKTLKIRLWIIIGIIAIILVPDTNMYYQQLKLKFDTLPEVYKNYYTLDSIQDDYYEVLEIVSDYYEPVLQINDTIIVIITGNSKETDDGSRVTKNVWYKVNPKGKIIDSLRYEYNDRKENHFYRTYHGYIVDTHKNTYCTWLTTSDTATTYFKNLQEGKVFSTLEARNITTKNEFMHAERISSDQDVEEAKYKLIMYKDEVWNYFYTDKDWYESATYYTNNFEVKYEPTTYVKSSIIKRVFVKKEEWIGNSFWHLDFGYGSGPRGDRWDGTSYFEITMPNKKLYFSQPVEIASYDNSLRDRFTYNIYKPKNGDYLLLNDIENSRIYLIRPKNKI